MANVGSSRDPLCRFYGIVLCSNSIALLLTVQRPETLLQLFWRRAFKYVKTSCLDPLLSSMKI